VPFKALAFLCLIAFSLVSCTDINFNFGGLLANSYSGEDQGEYTTYDPALIPTYDGYVGGVYVPDFDCSEVGTYEELNIAFRLAVCNSTSPCPTAGFPNFSGINSGFGIPMWAATCNRYGYTCAVVFAGENNLDSWPYGRGRAAMKASCANGFSNDFVSLSTTNLYQPTQPGGSLWHITITNLMNPLVVFDGLSSNYGNPCGYPNQDGMCFKKSGGVVAFGGGLALFNSEGHVVGGIGVAGDTSCTDHFGAWRARSILKLDYVPGTPVAGNYDNINFYGADGTPSPTGFGQPQCTPEDAAIAASLVVPGGPFTPRTPYRK